MKYHVLTRRVSFAGAETRPVPGHYQAVTRPVKHFDHSDQGRRLKKSIRGY